MVEEKIDDTIEEKVKTEVKLDIGLTEIMKTLVDEIKSVKVELAEMKKVKQEIAPPAKAIAEEEKPKVIDETKGIINNKNVAESSDNVVIERADMGKGFQIYRDYSKLQKDESCKLKRLIR